MRGHQSKEEILNFRLHNTKQDLAMIDARVKKLERERALLILKLVATRERILAEKEQDE